MGSGIFSWGVEHERENPKIVIKKHFFIRLKVKIVSIKPSWGQKNILFNI
jgi:hypothetical protein